MSFSSPREAASAEAARFNAQQASALGNIALPEIQNALQGILKDFRFDANGGTAIPGSVDKAFAPVREGINADYKSLGRTNQAVMQQSALQSGQPYTTPIVSDRILDLGQTLEASRRTALRNLQFEEASAGMNQYNNLLQSLGVGSGAALNLASGFSGGQAQAIGGFSNSSRGGGALAGALSGAAAGTAAYPGWGTLIGGALGAAGGYWGGGG